MEIAPHERQLAGDARCVWAAAALELLGERDLAEQLLDERFEGRRDELATCAVGCAAHILPRDADQDAMLDDLDGAMRDVGVSDASADWLTADLRSRLSRTYDHRPVPDHLCNRDLLALVALCACDAATRAGMPAPAYAQTRAAQLEMLATATA